MQRRLALVVGGISLVAAGAVYATVIRPSSSTNATRSNVRQGQQTAIGQLNLGAPFTLTDQHGNKRSTEEFKGKYLLIYFGFAHCPDFCPVELAKLGKVMQKLDLKNPDMAKLIFVSVDPKRDTPEVLKKFAEPYYPKALFLTGSMQEIVQVAKSFRVYFSAPNDENDEHYQVDHSLYTFFADKDGKVVNIFGNDLTDKEILQQILNYDRNGTFR